MSKPKKGYQRKSVDLKEGTMKRIRIAAVKADTTPKEYLEEIIEQHSSNLPKQKP